MNDGRKLRIHTQKLPKPMLQMHTMVNNSFLFNVYNQYKPLLFMLCKNGDNYISFISYHTFKHLVTCPNLPGPANGQVAESGSTPHFTAKYTCNTGYRLVGDSPRTCQDNGQWSGTTPTCEPSKYGIIISKDVASLC